ncbi:MAG: hypothetical protein U0996_23830 [Planctomycetaceae bacterium]
MSESSLPFYGTDYQANTAFDESKLGSSGSAERRQESGKEQELRHAP